MGRTFTNVGHLLAISIGLLAGFADARRPLIGLGYLWRASAPARAIGWALLVLYLTYTTKMLGDLVGRPLVGPFLAGLILIPLTSFIARRFRSAPATQVMGLPAFWMLVPGSTSVTGVSDLIRHQTALGTHIIVTALATILAIAVGTLMGSGLTRPDRPEPDSPPPSASAATDRPAAPGAAVSTSTPGSRGDGDTSALSRSETRVI